jgi:hypothetical protein
MVYLYAIVGIIQAVAIVGVFAGFREVNAFSYICACVTALLLSVSMIFEKLK